MIIITGTKRSGTSMWMQILKASGLNVVGREFPGNWGDTIRDANKRGFYESGLRRGIYYQTNPDPESGRYMPAHKTRDLAVKVFVPGLIRSERAYLYRVIASMRPWREYASSLRRLYALEDDAKREAEGEDVVLQRRMDPVLEWWLENFTLIRDMVTRRYPFHMISYDRALRDPDSVMKTLQWAGAPDPASGAAAIDATQRTRSGITDDAETHEFADLFDELYEHADSEKPLVADFIIRLNEAHTALVEAIESERRAVVASARGRRRPMPVTHPDVLERLIHRDE